VVADRRLVRRKPRGRSLASEVAQLAQEVPIAVQFAGRAEARHHLLRLDHVKADHAQMIAVLQALLFDQLGHEVDGAHLAHHRCVEADLVDAVRDLARSWEQQRYGWD
jgi:hypothetical protein